MSYQKLEWVKGDIVTANKLNHIDDGIETIETSVNTKITAPSGGQVGNVLKKTATGVEWGIDGGLPTIGSGDEDKILTVVDGQASWETPTTCDVNSVNGQTGTVVLDSGDIAYDNTDSGLVADDVQDAIDELASDIGTAESEITAIKDGTTIDSFADVETGLSGKADLENGKIPSSQLPSYVDDILEGTYVNSTTFNNPDGNAYTPETGKIYVDTTSNYTYRWSNSVYVKVNDVDLTNYYTKTEADTLINAKYTKPASGIPASDLASGVIPSEYTLPTASASTLGGVKVGSNLSIDANGVLSATGGDSVYVVTFDMDEETVTANKTVTEIYQHFHNGELVIGRLSPSGEFDLICNAADWSGTEGTVLFSTNYEGLKITIDGQATDNSGTITDSWTMEYDQVYIPKMSSEDNGKVLTVHYSEDSGCDARWEDKDEIPTPEASDEGKVLTVDNGEGKWRTPSTYTLPTASAATLGGVKVGSGLAIDSNGVLSASGGSDLFLVKTVYEGSSQYRADKTADEIYTATIAGKKVIMQEQYQSTDSEYTYFELVNADKDNNNVYEIKFSNVKNYNNDDYNIHKIRYGFRTITEGSASSVLYSKEDVSVPNYPSLSGAAGKFLKVDDNEEGFEWAEAGESYTLPTASTSTLGGVKIDGTSITINDGVISSSGGSGGAEIYWVNIEWVEAGEGEEEGHYVAKHNNTIINAEDIYEAYEDGKIVQALCDDCMIFTISYVEYSQRDSSFSITFSQTMPNDGDCSGTSIHIYKENDDETIEVTEFFTKEIPYISSEAADRGKVLTIKYDSEDDKNYMDWDNVPKELPASLGTAGQVLTVNSGATGVEWATPSSSSGSSQITTSADGNMVYNGNEIIAPKKRTVATASYSISDEENVVVTVGDDSYTFRLITTETISKNTNVYVNSLTYGENTFNTDSLIEEMGTNRADAEYANDDDDIPAYYMLDGSIMVAMVVNDDIRSEFEVDSSTLPDGLYFYLDPESEYFVSSVTVIEETPIDSSLVGISAETKSIIDKLSATSDGHLQYDDTTIGVYSLPIASSSMLGGVKVDNSNGNMTIDSSTGVLTADSIKIGKTLGCPKTVVFELDSGASSVDPTSTSTQYGSIISYRDPAYAPTGNSSTDDLYKYNGLEIYNLIKMYASKSESGSNITDFKLDLRFTSNGDTSFCSYKFIDAVANNDLNWHIDFLFTNTTAVNYSSTATDQNYKIFQVIGTKDSAFKSFNYRVFDQYPSSSSGGGEEVYDIYFSNYSSSSNITNSLSETVPTYTCDKTISEIASAISNGNKIVGHLGNNIFTISEYDSSEYTTTMLSASEGVVKILHHYSLDNATLWRYYSEDISVDSVKKIVFTDNNSTITCNYNIEQLYDIVTSSSTAIKAVYTSTSMSGTYRFYDLSYISRTDSRNAEIKFINISGTGASAYTTTGTNLTGIRENSVDTWTLS